MPYLADRRRTKGKTTLRLKESSMMKNRTGIRVALLILTVAAALATTTTHAAVDPGKKCSATKVKATAKALLCQAKEQNKVLHGGSADLEGAARSSRMISRTRKGGPTALARRTATRQRRSIRS